MDFSINHIFYPTDFSKNAEWALPFAAEIACQTGAKLTLFHANQETMDFAPSFEAAKEENIQDTSHLFDELISKLKENDKYKDLNTTTLLQSGLPTTNLLDQIAAQKPDLVVMGTKGATGNRNVLFGSVTTSVITKSEIPVLAVPNGSSLDQFNNITFATNFKEGDLGALLQTIDFAKIFDSSIDVFHVAEEQNLEREIKFRGFRDLVKSQTDYKKIDFYSKHEYDFFTGAADYLIDHSTSLLVMIRYKKTFWEKLAERNHSKEMAFYSKVPLMVFIGENNTYDHTILKETAIEYNS